VHTCRDGCDDTTIATVGSYFVHKLTRSLSAAMVVFVVLASGSGCGGDKPAGAEVEVKVRGNVITKAMVDHWLHVTAVRDYQLHPLTPAPSGVVPDPPRYTKCIAYMKAIADKPLTPKPAPGTSFKAQCEQRDQALRTQVLNSLITGYWLIGEGETRGLVATDQAIKQYFEMTWKNAYKNKAEFDTSLRNAGETISDQLLRAKIKVFSTEIEKQYGVKGGVGANPALLKFLAAFPKKWAARTTCKQGYVVANCKEYKGKLSPEAQLF
jgi:hypothetical protein